MSVSRDLAAHLRYLETMGVGGFSRDASWRVRPATASMEPAMPSAGTQPAAEPGPSESGGAPPPEAPLPTATSLVQTPDGRLRMIRDDIGDCTRCKLHSGRTNLVFGVGSPDARLMFIGEGPGADEDEQGEPFVGRAGQLLTQIIKAMGFAREEVYIANVVKCRPPGNRNPEPDEIAQCSPFLHAQIAAIGPDVIVALGKFAAQVLLQTETPISRLRGRFHQIGGIAVMPTFHPSYLLRNPSAKREVWEDMKMVMKYLSEAGTKGKG